MIFFKVIRFGVILHSIFLFKHVLNAKLNKEQNIDKNEKCHAVEYVYQLSPHGKAGCE